MKISDDVYKISGEGNVYLILKPEPIVIDSGCMSQKNSIRIQIESIVPLDQIKKVLLTHLHYDHSGNVDLFPNAEFYADEEEIEDFKINHFNFFFSRVPTEVYDVLMNKLVPFQGRINELEVIQTPGHTRGCVSFVDHKNKLLFTGDTLFNNGVGRTDLENSVPKKMTKSLNKLRALIKKGYKLLPGHDY
ncbi:MAG: MBL fold metallo-hydrolase [archaeon]|nr:MBL fold metallo-hydrolase [archaeon]MCR4323454.1 MBL fold metallo-hydrolase [Nanoarchaeota archaeon]